MKDLFSPSTLLNGVNVTTKEKETAKPEGVPQLLIFVNPLSGPGISYKVFREQVLPILTASQIRFHLVITDRSNCARDIVTNTDLSQWSAIIIVSGDGLLNEVINGLMSREDWETAIKMPLGIIPVGTGNGLARSLSYMAGEEYDKHRFVCATQNVIQDKTSPVDLVRVDTMKGPIYSLLSCGWGIMSDIDIESERLRAFGEARFSMWAVIRAFDLKRYKGRVTYLPIEGYKHDNKMEVPSNMWKISRKEAIAKSYTWPSCFINKSWKDARGHVIKTKKPDVTFPDFPVTANAPKEAPQNNPILPPLTDPLPDNWVCLESEFVLVYATYQPYLGKDVFFTPFAKPDDGIIWLALIHKEVSRWETILILSRLYSGTYINSDKVDMIPVRAFRLEPLVQDGHLTVDGELIDTQPIQAEILPSFARVLTKNKEKLQ